MFSKMLIGSSLLLLTSCSMYKQEFDCPTPQGVPCYSETELESMIIETKDGCADQFSPPPKGMCKSCEEADSDLCLTRKVWICNQEEECNCPKRGYYLYSSKLEDTQDVE